MSGAIYSEGFIALFVGNTETLCGHLGSYYFIFAVEKLEFNIRKGLSRACIDFVDDKRGGFIVSGGAAAYGSVLIHGELIDMLGEDIAARRSGFNEGIAACGKSRKPDLAVLIRYAACEKLAGCIIDGECRACERFAACNIELADYDLVLAVCDLDNDGFAVSRSDGYAVNLIGDNVTCGGFDLFEIIIACGKIIGFRIAYSVGGESANRFSVRVLHFIDNTCKTFAGMLVDLLNRELALEDMVHDGIVEVIAVFDNSIVSRQINGELHFEKDNGGIGCCKLLEVIPACREISARLSNAAVVGDKHFNKRILRQLADPLGGIEPEGKADAGDGFELMSCTVVFLALLLELEHGAPALVVHSDGRAHNGRYLILIAERYGMRSRVDDVAVRCFDLYNGVCAEGKKLADSNAAFIGHKSFNDIAAAVLYFKLTACKPAFSVNRGVDRTPVGIVRVNSAHVFRSLFYADAALCAFVDDFDLDNIVQRDNCRIDGTVDDVRGNGR